MIVNLFDFNATETFPFIDLVDLSTSTIWRFFFKYNLSNCRETKVTVSFISVEIWDILKYIKYRWKPLETIVTIWNNRKTLTVTRKKKSYAYFSSKIYIFYNSIKLLIVVYFLRNMKSALEYWYEYILYNTKINIIIKNKFTFY